MDKINRFIYKRKIMKENERMTMMVIEEGGMFSADTLALIQGGGGRSSRGDCTCGSGNNNKSSDGSSADDCTCGSANNNISSSRSIDARKLQFG